MSLGLSLMPRSAKVSLTISHTGMSFDRSIEGGLIDSVDAEVRAKLDYGISMGETIVNLRRNLERPKK